MPWYCSVMKSPYAGKKESDWSAITQRLIDDHPLPVDTLRNTVLAAWDSIFRSRIGDFTIGTDIKPQPQTMGFLLHEIIGLELQRQFPEQWKRETDASDKDVQCLTDDRYSLEIKTSSNPNAIFGNRSYAQASKASKKGKFGYYLAINFEKFSDTDTPKVLKIRFGWLDHTDWIGQKAQTGQQSRLSPAVQKYKLLQIYPADNDG